MRAHHARREEVVQPREDGASDQPVEECPHGADQAATESQIVAAVHMTDPGGIYTSTIERHDPPGQERQTESPDYTTGQRERLNINLHHAPRFSLRLQGSYLDEHCVRITNSTPWPTDSSELPGGIRWSV